MYVIFTLVLFFFFFFFFKNLTLFGSTERHVSVIGFSRKAVSHVPKSLPCGRPCAEFRGIVLQRHCLSVKVLAGMHRLVGDNM